MSRDHLTPILLLARYWPMPLPQYINHQLVLYLCLCDAVAKCILTQMIAPLAMRFINVLIGL